MWDADYPWDIRTQKICAALTRSGHEVHILARNRSWNPEAERLQEGTVHRMKPWRRLGRRLDAVSSFPAFINPRWITHLRGTVRSVAPDVIVVRDLPLCPTAIRAGRRAEIPVVLDMAENYPAMIRDIWIAGRWKVGDVLVRNPFLVSMVERACLPRVDHTLVVVEESKERLVDMGVPADKVSVVSNTPPRERALEKAVQEPGDGRVRLVYLGLMEIPRGVGDVLDAMAILKNGGAPRLTLTLIGEGRDRAFFESRAADLGLVHGDVSFLGYVENREALATVAKADVGLIPHHANESWNTTIPNKLFDYMAAGLVVLSSDARPCARVVKEAEAGLVFRSGDARNLADKMKALSDPELRRRMGQAGREAVANRYNWESDVTTLEAALSSVVP